MICCNSTFLASEEFCCYIRDFVAILGGNHYGGIFSSNYQEDRGKHDIPFPISGADV